MRWVWLALCLIWGLAAPVLGQEDEEDNGFLVNLIQDSLSTEDRQIRLRGINGLLASDARVAEITVADREGVWLTIRDADIVWTRRALLSGRLKIDSLRAASIEMTRTPQADQSPPSLEAEPFSLPDLPISVEIGELSVPDILLSNTPLGDQVELSVEGFLNLVDGTLATDLSLLRKDAEGEFKLAAAFDNASRNLAVDLAFKEPENGIVANLLKIEGRPSLDVRLSGDGPLENIDLILTASTDGQAAIEGQLSLREADQGIGFEADLQGGLSPLITSRYRNFFEGESRIDVSGVSREGGGFDVSAMTLKTAALDLTGNMSTTNDGFLRRLEIAGQLGDGTTSTVLPFGENVSVLGADLDVSYGVDPTGLWQAKLLGKDLNAGEISAQAFNLLFQGTIDGVETPSLRRMTINAVGDMSGLKASTDDLTRALGQRLTFQLASEWSPGTYRISRARFGGAAARIELEGLLEDFGFDGNISAKIERLAPFGGAFDRDLQGAVDLTLSGRINPLLGSFDLEVDGTSEALKLDIAALDPLLVGSTELGGRMIRNETGFRTQNLRLSNPQLTLTSDGILSTERADLEFNATLRDLAVLTKRANGAVVFTGTAKGNEGRIALDTDISVPTGALLDKPLRGLTAKFNGTLEDGNVSGTIAGRGALDDEPLRLAAGVAIADGVQSLNDLEFELGSTRFSGDILRGADGLMRGGLDLNSPDVSLLATLFLQEASGQATAKLDLSRNALGQQIIASGTLGDIVFGQVELGQATLDAQIENAFGVPTIAGALEFENALAGGVEITAGQLTAGGRDGQNDFTLNVALENATNIRSVGALNATDDGFNLVLSRLDLDRGTPLLRLEDQATARITGARVDLDRLALRVGDGRLQAQGTLNGGYDLTLDLDNIPLSLANAFRDDLGLTGTVSGDAALTGPQNAPDLAFELAARAISAAALEEAQLPPFNISASGQTAGETVALEIGLNGASDLASTITGDVNLSTQEMNLNGQLSALPLALLDGLIGRQGLRGNVTGGFNLLGTPAKPRVNFDLSGRGISVATMRDNAISALAFSTSGSFVNNVITLPDARITGADATNFSVSGRIPLQLDGLNAAASGTLPLSVLNVALARNGLAATGTANLSLRARGRATAPDLSGTLRLQNGTFVSSTANVRLEDVTLIGDFAGDRFNLTQGSARNSRGGDISANGSITINTVEGFPIDLSTRVTNLRYTDGRLATALVNGALTLRGALLRTSEIAGDVDIEELEFSLPQQLGTKKSYQLDVQHVNLTPQVRQTLDRAGKSAIPVREVRPDSDISFDVNVNAPNQVFVRGRGVDAELGGQLKLGGTTRNLKPVGQFNLIRGRINILARRIELDEGSITFEGNLDPAIYLRARTLADDVEANVTLEGPATKPVLAFSSVPELPDDEVLARLVFDRSLADLSALQVAQLAAAAGELSGRTGPSFFSQLRDATGLDDLDFETDNEGTTTVRVGKYIQDNIYSSIEADNKGSSRATINLDINQNFTARGTLDSEGNTSFGIFFEKDY